MKAHNFKNNLQKDFRMEFPVTTQVVTSALRPREPL